MELLIAGTIVSILVAWVGSIEIKTRNLDMRLRDVPSRHEVSEEIKVRQESIKILQHEIKEDIREIKRQIEKLADK